MGNCGMKWLSNPLKWRNSAEIGPVSFPGLRESTKPGSVTSVAGPSNKQPAANCQNRYPSPSKRSDHTLVRPLNLWWCRLGIAGLRAVGEKPFAFRRKTTASGRANPNEESRILCKKVSMLLLSQLFCRFRPVVTRRWNKALWVPVRALLPQQFWVQTRSRARPLVPVLTLYSASRIQAPATNTFLNRTDVVRLNLFGHRDTVPVAFHLRRAEPQFSPAC